MKLIFFSPIFYNSFLILFIIIINSSIYSQNQFKSLNSDNGLSSNNINNVFQDSKGFLWISTDNGLCRWDSKNFKTYTIADGLPNNEVYYMVEDKEGRLWFSTFSNELCYYKNDTIFNHKNDKRLNHVKIIKAGHLESYNNEIYYINDYNHRINKFNINTLKIEEIKNFKNKSNGNQFRFFNDSLYLFFYIRSNNFCTLELSLGDYNSIFYGWDFEAINDTLYKILDYNSKTCYLLEIDDIHKFFKKYSYKLESDSTLIFPQSVNNLKIKKYPKLDLNDSNIKVIYSKKFDNGLRYFFKLKNEFIFIYKSYILNSKNQRINVNFDINYVRCFKNELYFSTPKGVKIYNQVLAEQIYNPDIIKYNIHKLFRLDDKYVLFDNYTKLNIKDKKISNVNVNTKLYNISKDQNNLPSITSSRSIVNLKTNQKIESDSFNISQNYFKGFYFSDFFKIYIINNGNYGFFSQSLDKKIKKISSRIAYTSFIDSKNRLWMGSVSNLYLSYNFLDSLKDEQEIILNKNFNLFCSEIQEDNSGNIFFTTNDGIYVIDKNNFKYHLCYSNLLSSNECKTLKLDAKHHSIFIATTNGLNQIKYNLIHNKLHFEVINKFFKSDGLSSNEIKDILIDGDSVLVATANGLDIITNTQYRPDTTFIPIYYNSIFINDSQINFNKNSISLSYNQNNIKIDFSAIYYSRRDRLDILYKLIIGRDTTIGKIKDNNLQFLSLQPGNYKLQIFAYDKDYPYTNGYSKVLEFVIKKPFYSTWWFFILIFISSLLVVNSILRYRNKLKYNQLKTESELNKFRLKGLQNQMNPHFIFNSMSTIQNFIINKKDEHALNFISDFSSLMRNMLDNSRNDSISLENELEFLNRYIQLELIRYEYKFDVNIENKIDEIDLEELYIPTMMIQPLVENAIKHGVSNLNEKKGKIQIEFSLDKSLKFLKVVIQDNGYGFDSNKNKKYKSSAIAILEERLQLYNKSVNFGSYEIVYSKEGTTCILTLPI